MVTDEAVDAEDQHAGATLHYGVRLGGQAHVGDDAHFLRQAAALHVQAAVVLTGNDLQRAFATGNDQRRGAQYGARLLVVLGIQHARAPDDQLALAEVAEGPGYGSVTARTRLLISLADLCHRISPSAAVRRPK